MNLENEKLVQQIQQSFFRLLNDYLPKELINKAKESNQIKIISIGCGRFREAKSIFNYFSSYIAQVKLYGIDINNELLNFAKNEQIIKENKNSVYLKLADASKLESYEEWLNDSLFDLVIVRHPEITFNTDVFIKIFSLCHTKLLVKGGYILATTHFENEKESLKLLLNLVKFNTLVDIENQGAPQTKKEGKILYADRFLLIASL